MKTIIVEVIILVIFIIPTIYAFCIGAPILFTPKISIRKTLEYCKIKKGGVFYDLGSGTGRNLIIASREFGLKSVGFELSPILFLISKINLFLHRVEADVWIKNFYHSDLSEADIIFCFLSSKAMKKLSSKFEKELKSGTKIISYSFPISNWNPIKIINTNNPGKIFIYEKN